MALVRYWRMAILISDNGFTIDQAGRAGRVATAKAMKVKRQVKSFPLRVIRRTQAPFRRAMTWYPSLDLVNPPWAERRQRGCAGSPLGNPLPSAPTARASSREESGTTACVSGTPLQARKSARCAGTKLVEVGRLQSRWTRIVTASQDKIGAI